MCAVYNCERVSVGNIPTYSAKKTVDLGTPQSESDNRDTIPHCLYIPVHEIGIHKIFKSFLNIWHGIELINDFDLRINS